MSRHRNIRNISLDDGKFSLPNHFPKNVIFRNKINILLFPIYTAQNYLPPITLLLLYFTFAFYKQILSGSLLKKNKNKQCLVNIEAIFSKNIVFNCYEAFLYLPLGHQEFLLII